MTATYDRQAGTTRRENHLSGGPAPVSIQIFLTAACLLAAIGAATLP